jgi:hypothetical protein
MQLEVDPISVVSPGRAMPHFSKLDAALYSDLHDCSRHDGLWGQDADAIL